MTVCIYFLSALWLIDLEVDATAGNNHEFVGLVVCFFMTSQVFFLSLIRDDIGYPSLAPPHPSSLILDEALIWKLLLFVVASLSV